MISMDENEQEGLSRIFLTLSVQTPGRLRRRSPKRLFQYVHDLRRKHQKVHHARCNIEMSIHHKQHPRSPARQQVLQLTWPKRSSLQARRTLAYDGKL